MAYAKLQCLNGKDCYISQLPFSIGSSYQNDLIIPCSQIHSRHCLIDYSKSFFTLKAYAPTLLHQTGVLTHEDPPVQLKDLCLLGFQCNLHPPHLYFFIKPVFASSILDHPRKAPIPQCEDMLQIDTFHNRQADSSILKSWGVNDRQNLKKWLLTFGYKRWKKLQESMSEGGAFQQKPIPQIRSFATALLRTIIENLPFEKHSLRKQLLGMIQEKPEDFYIFPKTKEWGNVVRQRTVPWGKRICMLQKIRELIKAFKMYMAQNQARWGSLLNFIPAVAFYGQRPAPWWTKRHDVDLIRGTHIHGYANYAQMRVDTSLSFDAVETDSTFKQFPSADTITRRLKKIMMFIQKAETYDFSLKHQMFEKTEWTDHEKKALINLLTVQGVKINSEGKNDWANLKERFDLIVQGKHVNSFQKMVQHLKMLAQMTLHPDQEATEIKDADGFIIEHLTAENFMNNYNKLQFIRKHILKNDLFTSELSALIRATEKLREENKGKEPWLQEYWDCSIHDKQLLEAVNARGLQLQSLDVQIPISPTDIQKRIDYLCAFFKGISNIVKSSKKKRPSDDLVFDEKGQIKPSIQIKKPKNSKFNVPRDEEGNIKYPLIINNSLTILNLGEIETQRSAYHSGRNIFPIGFKSIREHPSIFFAKERMQYLCQILDGGSKPLFKVTPMINGQFQDENSILKDSCTGCWIVICNKVNQIQKSRRSKVTVSGTDRFGLWDPNVVKLIHQLPGAQFLVPSSIYQQDHIFQYGLSGLKDEFFLFLSVSGFSCLKIFLFFKRLSFMIKKKF